MWYEEFDIVDVYDRGGVGGCNALGWSFCMDISGINNDWTNDIA